MALEAEDTLKITKNTKFKFLKFVILESLNLFRGQQKLLGVCTGGLMEREGWATMGWGQ